MKAKMRVSPRAVEILHNLPVWPMKIAPVLTLPVDDGDIWMTFFRVTAETGSPLFKNVVKALISSDWEHRTFRGPVTLTTLSMPNGETFDHYLVVEFPDNYKLEKELQPILAGDIARGFMNLVYQQNPVEPRPEPKHEVQGTPVENDQLRRGCNVRGYERKVVRNGEVTIQRVSGHVRHMALVTAKEVLPA